jgi:hypothetical protein
LAIILLVTLYLYIHYGFASMTAQVTALYPSFLTAALTVGINPFVSALSLAYFSNLNAAMTHYGTGSAPVYFGVGYVSQGAWWKVGFLISLVNLVLWMGLGCAGWPAGRERNLILETVEFARGTSWKHGRSQIDEVREGIIRKIKLVRFADNRGPRYSVSPVAQGF